MKKNIDTKSLIEEMDMLLSKKAPVLESLMMPDEDPIACVGDECAKGPECCDGEKCATTGCCIKDEVDQIRQIALEAICKLAQDPSSEAYQFAKKIWNLCDKFVEPQKGGMDTEL
ncbi:MAG: hypothetical protein LUD72_04165 [Bacteroidales bacterium]|nr:hypothetical protein [Bacteroidales bacterium]